MTKINPYKPISTSCSGPFTAEQQEAARRRRGLNQKLNNAGTGALIGGTGNGWYLWCD
jgi:hypothetical protein